MYCFNRHLAWDVFQNEKMVDIAENVAERIVEENIESFDDLPEEIDDAMENELIYTEDQWEVVKFYSSPDDPRSFGDCWEELNNDIKNCYDYEI